MRPKQYSQQVINNVYVLKQLMKRYPTLHHDAGIMTHTGIHTAQGCHTRIKFKFHSRSGKHSRSDKQANAKCGATFTVRVDATHDAH
mmetsp:Transcript_52684/g.87271  ORF Transcript_52684/g.87271 Transcript_52684/m.87271 type:complete len:87 (+) Transcript_52684:15-275(+)